MKKTMVIKVPVDVDDVKGKLKDAIKVADEVGTKTSGKELLENMKLIYEEPATLRWYEGNPRKCVTLTIGGIEFSI